MEIVGGIRRGDMGGALEVLLVKVLRILEIGDTEWTDESTLELTSSLNPESRRVVEGWVARLREGGG